MSICMYAVNGGIDYALKRKFLETNQVWAWGQRSGGYVRWFWGRFYFNYRQIRD